jgi:hypothetical protein
MSHARPGPGGAVLYSGAAEGADALASALALLPPYRIRTQEFPTLPALPQGGGVTCSSKGRTPDSRLGAGCRTRAERWGRESRDAAEDRCLGQDGLACLCADAVSVNRQLHWCREQREKDWCWPRGRVPGLWCWSGAGPREYVEYRHSEKGRS